MNKNICYDFMTHLWYYFKINYLYHILETMLTSVVCVELYLLSIHSLPHLIHLEV